MYIYCKLCWSIRREGKGSFDHFVKYILVLDSSLLRGRRKRRKMIREGLGDDERIHFVRFGHPELSEVD